MPDSTEETKSVLTAVSEAVSESVSEPTITVSEAVIEPALVQPLPESPFASEHQPKPPCEFCSETSFNDCFICHRPFCKVHVSRSDLSLCHECSADPTDTLQTDLKIEPLVDDEGVTHTGKRITPVGDTYVVTQYIDRLTDDELKLMLGEYQQKIRDAEKLLYSRVIVHSTLSGALSERDRKKRIRDKAARLVTDASGAKTIVLPGPSQRKSSSGQGVSINTSASAVSEALKGAAATMTPDQKAKMLVMLRALKAKLG